LQARDHYLTATLKLDGQMVEIIDVEFSPVLSAISAGVLNAKPGRRVSICACCDETHQSLSLANAWGAARWRVEVVAFNDGRQALDHLKAMSRKARSLGELPFPISGIQRDGWLYP
jgi:hypothetical protein